MVAPRPLRRRRRNFVSSTCVNNAAFQVHSYAIEDLGDEHFDETFYGYFHMV